MNISTISVQLPRGIPEVVTPYPPTPFQSLLFYCNNPVYLGRGENIYFEKQPLTVLTGPQFTRVNIKVVEQLHAIRVDFLPGGMHRMLGIPMHELFDCGFDAVDLLGSDMRIISEQLQDSDNLEEGKQIVENFLLKRLTTLKDILPIDAALNVLLKNFSSMSITDTAALACLSVKQFERKCKERIGMNPKTFARILRFSKAYRMHEANPQMKWTKITYEAGYYDQMHLVKDFKIFAGVKPSVIGKQLLSTPIRMQKDIPG